MGFILVKFIKVRVGPCKLVCNFVRTMRFPMDFKVSFSNTKGFFNRQIVFFIKNENIDLKIKKV